MSEEVLPEDLRPSEAIRKLRHFPEFDMVVAFEILPDGRVNLGLFENQADALKQIAIVDDPMMMFHDYRDLGPAFRLFTPKDFFCSYWFQEQAAIAGFPTEFNPVEHGQPGAPVIAPYLMMICPLPYQEILYNTLVGLPGGEKGNIA